MIFYFILGILFIDCLLPILEGITGCICTRFEEYKAKHALQITKYNNDITEINDPTPLSNPIGFQITSINDEEEYDD